MRRIRSQRRHGVALYYLISNVVLLLLCLWSGAFGLLFALNAVLSVVYRRRIAKILVTTSSCFSCGARFDLGQTAWACTCGYQRVGHVFDRCPKCGLYMGFFPCPRCGMSLDV